MAMFKAAASAFMPKDPGAKRQPPPIAGDAARTSSTRCAQQMAAMQKKLDQLGE